MAPANGRARLPSALASLLSVALVFVLARTLGLSLRAATAAAILLALAPLDIWYAREARMYALVAMAALVFAIGVTWDSWFGVPLAAAALTAGPVPGLHDRPAGRRADRARRGALVGDRPAWCDPRPPLCCGAGGALAVARPLASPARAVDSLQYVTFFKRVGEMTAAGWPGAGAAGPGHLTGIVVSCQNEKSQLQNKEQALRILRARLLAAARADADAAVADARRSQVRTVDRSERVRTYNFPENRIADHRVGYKAYNLDAALDGDLDGVLDALAAGRPRRAARRRCRGRGMTAAAAAPRTGDRSRGVDPSRRDPRRAAGGAEPEPVDAQELAAHLLGVSAHPARAHPARRRRLGRRSYGG